MNKRIARTVGTLFIVGTVAGILSMSVVPIINAPNYLIKISENQNRVIWGALLVLTMGISLSVMSVMLFPVLRKYNEAYALGAVVFRGALEMISYIGIALSWLLLIVLSKEFVSAGAPNASHFQLAGTLLLNAALLLGEIGSILFCIGTFIIYCLFYKAKLVPTWLSLWGAYGAVIYLAAGIMLMFVSGIENELLKYIIENEYFKYILGVQEMVMASWLIVKGFNASAFDFLMAKQ